MNPKNPTQPTFKKVFQASDIVDILLNESHITSKQVEHAKRVASKLEIQKPLLVILKELKFITDDNIKSALANSDIEMPIETILLEMGIVSDKDIKIAKETVLNDKSKKSIEKVLVDSQLVDEGELFEILSLKAKIPYVSIEQIEIDQTLFSNAQVKWYETIKAIPLKKEKEGIRVGFVDIPDRKRIEAAQKIFGTKILPSIISGDYFKKALNKVTKGQTKEQSSNLEENATIQLVNKIILAAISRDASDIHIEPLAECLRIRFRQDGVLTIYEQFPKDIISALTNRIKVLCNVDITEKRRHQGGRIFYQYNGEELDLRVSFYVTVYGEKIVIRLLNRKGLLLKLDDIGMSKHMLTRFKEDALYQPSGVILITGPTGSGKTTTVYSCIQNINTPQTSIITAEEPVEYIIDGISQCSINPKISLTFEETLRHIVRQDPDVIVIGEIRDNFSAEVAVQAALTGHKVLTTFHTEDSIGGLIRLLKMNIEAFLISSTVVSVLAQRLLRKICPKCKVAYKPSSPEIQRIGYSAKDLEEFSFAIGKGCPYCQHSGYKGRVGIFELLVLDESVRNAIMEQKTSQEIRRISIDSTGLVTLLEDGIYKAAAGITTIEEVFRCLPRLQKPRPLYEIKQLLGGR